MEQNLALLSPSPFSFYEDDDFEADMAELVPDERIRDQVVNSMELALTRAILGVRPAIGRTKLPDTNCELIVTQKTPVCPALRVLFSVEDEYPRRWVIFHRAGLKEAS